MAKNKQAEYQKLKKIWYAKLKKSGFVDIEDPDPKRTRLANRELFTKDEKFGNQHTPVWRQSKEEYYRMAEYFLNNYKFSSNLDRIIWEYHTNVISRQDIASTLKKMKLIKTGYAGVGATIRRLRKIMLIGAYEEVKK